MIWGNVGPLYSFCPLKGIWKKKLQGQWDLFSLFSFLAWSVASFILTKMAWSQTTFFQYILLPNDVFLHTFLGSYSIGMHENMWKFDLSKYIIALCNKDNLRIKSHLSVRPTLIILFKTETQLPSLPILLFWLIFSPSYYFFLTYYNIYFFKLSVSLQ